MPSLTAKKIHGRTYWYLRESAWVDGKSKIVKTRYLGSAEEVAAQLGKGPTQLDVVPGTPVVEFGAVMALYDLAQRLRLVALIDRHVPKRSGTPSVGTYLLLAAINRAVSPTSKAKLGSWFAGTSLGRWMKVSASQLTSQRFWDHMNRVSESALVSIERELSAQLIRDYDLDRRCLFYDATNFFSFIDSFNDRNSLAQRGKSKEGRDNLRILGLALLVSGDFGIPLFHYLYPGNQNDPTSFRSVVLELVDRSRQLTQGAEGITLVLDKGNNTEDALQEAGRAFHVVGSLVPGHHPELLAVPAKQFQRLDPARFKTLVTAYRTTKEVFGRIHTIVVTYNENLFLAQTKTLEREIAKRQLRLRRLQRDLLRAQPNGNSPRRRSVVSVRKVVASILHGRHMKDLFVFHVSESKNGPRLHFQFNPSAYRDLKRTLLGKTLLFTDQEQWSNEDIVTAYRGQHHVESAFRQMKDTRYLSFRPAHHWTDQKLMVHAFTCVLALLLCSLLRRELAKQGILLSVREMLGTLHSIREVHVALSTGRGRPRIRRTHSRLSRRAQALFQQLSLAQYLAT
jgi:transposase